MKTYLVTFKPTEPYFFGNEKTFVYPDLKNISHQANRYFIKSEIIPSQSTVLGALRYALLPIKRSDWGYSTAEVAINEQAVGKSGFLPSVEQSFGKIKKISPVFLTNGSDFLVPTPFDHKSGEKMYSPFSEYLEVKTPDGKRLFTPEYDSKNGITTTFLNLTTGITVPVEEIFSKVSRTGINRSVDNRGYFKKEFALLNCEYSFCVYLTLEGDLIPKNQMLFLGQGKSTFSFSFEEAENTITEDIKKYLQKGVVYCFGDAFIEYSVCKNTLFSVTKTKTYRAYAKFKNKVSKDSILYRLIASGSVFIPHNEEEFLVLTENKNANQIGYNEFIAK